MNGDIPVISVSLVRLPIAHDFSRTQAKARQTIRSRFTKIEPHPEGTKSQWQKPPHKSPSGVAFAVRRYGRAEPENQRYMAEAGERNARRRLTGWSTESDPRLSAKPLLVGPRSNR
jgi:hypothetical protein